MRYFFADLFSSLSKAVAVNWSLGATARFCGLELVCYGKCYVFFPPNFTIFPVKRFTRGSLKSASVHINYGCPNTLHLLCRTWDLNYTQLAVFITISLIVWKGTKGQLFPALLPVCWSLTWNANDLWHMTSSAMYVQQISNSCVWNTSICVSSNVNRNIQACWWGCLLRSRRRSFPSSSNVYCLWITPRIDSNFSSTTTWASAQRASCS